MSYRLQTKVFFFNAKRDYLPYYKHFTHQLNNEATALDLLVSIQSQHDAFTYPKSPSVMRINGLVVTGEQSIKSIVERCGNELTVEPVSSYRATHDLVINDADFMESFALLAPYASKEDRIYYESLYPLHYASHTTLFDKSYIGDAILVLAHKMIEEGSEHKEAILDAISTPCGLLSCEYENNLFETNTYGETIEALKTIYHQRDDDYPSLFEIIKTRLCSPSTKEKSHRQRASKSVQNLEDKSIAYHYGKTLHRREEVSAIVEQIGAREIAFASASRGLGVSIFHTNRELALKKAGVALFDAYDRGAEVLIIEDLDAYEMAQRYLSRIASIMGREIPNFELLYVEDLLTYQALETL
jgi:hypothetical protein